MSAFSTGSRLDALIEATFPAMGLDEEIYSPYLKPIVTSFVETILGSSHVHVQPDSPDYPPPDLDETITSNYQDNLDEISDLLDMLLASADPAPENLEEAHRSFMGEVLKTVKSMVASGLEEKRCALAAMESARAASAAADVAEAEAAAAASGSSSLNAPESSDTDSNSARKFLIERFGYEDEGEEDEIGAPASKHSAGNASAKPTTNTAANHAPVTTKANARAITKAHENDKKAKKEERRKAARKGERKR